MYKIENILKCTRNINGNMELNNCNIFNNNFNKEESALLIIPLFLWVIVYHTQLFLIDF